MAKKKTTKKAPATRTVVKTPAPIIVRAPSATARRVKAVRKYGHKARAMGISGAKSLLGVTQNQLVAIGGAAGLAFLQKQGIQVPKLVSSLSVPANAGIIAWAAARFLKSQTLDHIATGMLSAAAYAFAAGSPIQGDVMGYTTAGPGFEQGEGRAVVFDDVEGDDEEDGG